jgi:hypothetical protein
MVDSIIADGDAGSASSLDADDIITIQFDVDTNESGAGTGVTGTEMDAMFSVNDSAGAFGAGASTYDITYPTPDVMLITVTNATGATVVAGDAIAILAAANIKIPNGTSDAADDSATLGGHLGMPMIQSIVADDPDDLGGAFGVGDTITITFDAPTDTPAFGALDGTQVFSRFTLTTGSFGGPGMMYGLSWADSQTLNITVSTDDASSNVVIGDTITINVLADIQDANSSSGAITDSGTLVGDWGKPMILSIVADDPDDSEGTFDLNDTITITFDAPTNAPFSGYIAAITFGFSYLGTPRLFSNFGNGSYFISWSAASDVMFITRGDVVGADMRMGDPIVILDTANIQDSNSSSGATTDSGVLTGDWGKPMIVSVVADGTGGAAAGLDAGDTITITFDAPTDVANSGAVVGTTLDTRFTLNNAHSFGDGSMDYTAVWSDALTLVITVVTNGGTSTVAVGDTITVETAANIQDENSSSGATTAVSGAMTGSF